MSLAPVPVSSGGKPPTHVAIIMDGNGRWATARGKPRVFGHRAGAEAVRRAIETSVELGIEYLTLYSFSSENWNRPAAEISDLMGLLRLYLRKEIKTMVENGVRLRVIGDRARLSDDVVAAIDEAEEATRSGAKMTLVLALSYGGRDDIVSAARGLAQKVASGALSPEDITHETFAGELMTDGLPDPDLLIRTSGEQRISNFLLYQMAYTEMVFIDKYWPDFEAEDLIKAIEEFGRRDRRYGKSV